jgi:hypothetical protein
MSIEVGCRLCAWKGTVDDSIAGEQIACRACGASLVVPKLKKSKHASEYEVIEEPPPPKPAEKPPPTPEEEARRRKKAKAKERAKLLPAERSWFLSGRTLMYVGLAFLAAGVVTVIVDVVTSTSRLYPFILLGLGALVAISGFVIDQEQSKQ